MTKPNLGMLKESFAMSVANIRGSKLRSFLTILGIVIGVTAIIALITIVEGVQTQITGQFAQLGTGTVTVRVTGTALKSGLNDADLAELSALEGVRGLSPLVSTTANVQSENGWEEDVAIEGKNDAYFRRNDSAVLRGRALTPLDMDNDTHVCLIDKPLQEKLFFAQDPLGQTVRVNGLAYTIVGVLDDSSGMDVLSQAMGGGDNGKLIVPYAAALKLMGTRQVNTLELYVADTSETDAVIERVEQALNIAFNYKDDAYTIINVQSLLDTMDTIMGLMTALLASIASISLLVGGIGIMNMMLVSVTERTTEIGLRKALGAEPRQIQIQFLIESFLLSLLGGLIGLALGVALSFAFSVAIGASYTLSGMAISLGVGFSAAVGILFGWAPARKASNLNPIDALRSM